MTKIQLHNNSGFHWYKDKDVTAKGYIFDTDNHLWQAQDLAKYFDVNDFDTFREKVIQANGLFSVIIQKNDETWVATDRLRTFPLFFYKKAGEIVLTDNTHKTDLPDFPVNPLGVDELKASGYVSGDQTLLQGLYQVQAGEIICFSGSTIEKSFYHDYTTARQVDYDEAFAEKRFLKILDNIFERLIQSAGGRTLVIPLSGGYDSRLILSMLKQKNYKNVITFTYGARHSFEVPIARKVAKQLGYPWHFVEYTDEIYKNFPQDPGFLNYVNWVTNHSAVFLIQTFFAAKYLSNHKLIPDDSIFVTGVSGDFLAGSQLPGDMNFLYRTEADAGKITEEIYRRKYVYDTPKHKKQLQDNIRQSLKKNTYAYSLVENDFYKGKISKILVNSHRIYESLGYAHRVVLWDNEISDFFRDIDLRYKTRPFFYDKILKEKIFKPLAIDFVPEDKKIKQNFYTRLKARIKKLSPKWFIEFRLSLIAKNINNDKYRNKQLLDDLKEKTRGTAHIINLSAKWYLEKYINK